MFKKKQKDTAEPSASPFLASSIVEPLLGVHSASNVSWVADAATTAAERGIGALYSVLYRTDTAGQLAGQRPASNERMRARVRIHQALDCDLTALKFDPQERPTVASALQEGHAIDVPELEQALPLPLESDRIQDAQRQLGIANVWLAPLYWGGESLGLMALFIPANPAATLTQAELLGRHIAVAVSNLRQREAGRKRGELDAVRWVHDERRFLDELASEMRRAERHKRPLSVLLLRLLNFNELRTRYGNFLAERMLRHLGGLMTDTMRDTDFLGAFMEDGYAAILVEADQDGAKRAKERLQEGVATMTLPQADLPDLELTLTCATATMPEDGNTAEELTASAGARLDHGPAAQEVAA